MARFLNKNDKITFLDFFATKMVFRSFGQATTHYIRFKVLLNFELFGDL